MTKYDFEDWLRYRLSDLPAEELDRIAAFYRDAIDDRMEDGMTEEEAIYDLGEPEALLEGIRASQPETQTYQPVRHISKKAGNTRRLATVIVVVTTLIVTLSVLMVVFNLARVHTITSAFWNASTSSGVAVAPADTPMVEAVEISTPGADLPFDAATLEKVSVSAELGSVLVEPSPDERIHIVGDPVLYEAVRRGSTLYIENVESDFTLQLPNTALRLEIKCEVGDVELYEIVPRTLDVACDLGNIFLHGVSALNSITLEANWGNIEGTLRGGQYDYAIDVEVDLGKSNLSDHTHVGTGEEAVTLAVTADLGNVDIEFEE